MPTRWETYPIKFEGGLTTNLGRIEQGIQAPGSATILQNFEADVQGGYTRVLGYAKYSATALSGTGQVFGVVALNGSEALSVRGGQFQFSSGTTWTNVLALTSPLITRIRHDTFNFNGTRFTVVVDGVNAPAYFNHTSKTMAYGVGVPADVSGSAYVKIFKNHVFFGKGRILTFSAPYNQNDFTPGNGSGSINIGDEITGLAVFRETLFVFCLNKIFRIEGNTLSDFVLQTVTDKTGCLNGDTIQEVGGDIMYLGPDGVRYLSATERMNDFGLTRASEKVQKPLIQAVASSTSLASITVSEKNQYRLFFYTPTVSASSALGFVATKYSNQSVEDIAWSTLKGFKVYASDKYQDEDNEVILFCSDTGFIYKMENGTSLDGENIEAIFETPYMPISDPKIRKTFYKHSLYARASGNFSLTCSLKFDYAQTTASPSPPFEIQTVSGSSVYGTAIYGTGTYGGVPEEQFYSNTVGSGFVVALRYYSNSTQPTFNLNFSILEYRPNERR